MTIKPTNATLTPDAITAAARFDLVVTAMHTGIKPGMLAQPGVTAASMGATPVVPNVLSTTPAEQIR